MIKKSCFNGCSFTVGEGFPSESRKNHIYDHLVSCRFDLDRTNIAQGGSSNHEIFMRSADALKKDFDILFVQWSALNRMWLYPGPDSIWHLNDGHDEFHYREIQLDKKSKKIFENTLLMMNHDYHNICKLVDYCSILDRLSEHHGKIVVYINGLIPWTEDFARPLSTDLYESLSEYTKEILDFANRDDQEIIQLFTRLQQKFSELDHSRWVNLFDSFQSNIVDHGPLGHHPGIQSHKIMADKIVNYLENNQLIDQ
jgi:hypothetical protein